MFAFIRNLGTPELLIILVVVLLLFGAKKLPDLARSLGQSAKEFREGIGSDSSDSDEDAEDEDEAASDVEVAESGDAGDGPDTGKTSA